MLFPVAFLDSLGTDRQVSSRKRERACWSSQLYLGFVSAKEKLVCSYKTIHGEKVKSDQKPLCTCHHISGYVVEDALIFDDDFDAHVERVRQVLFRCNEAGITLHPPNFVFAEPEVDYCGFKVREFGYTISDQLVRALTDFVVPVNKTDVRSFCGLPQQFEPFTSGSDRTLGAFTPVNVLKQRLFGRSPSNKLSKEQ